MSNTEEGVHNIDENKSEEPETTSSQDDDNVYETFIAERNVEIEEVLQNQNQYAEEILNYLEKQHKDAYEKDKELDIDMKKKGLIINSNIPIGASNLDIDKTYVESFDNVTANMVQARDIVNANHINTLRRSGRMPIADGIVKRSVEDIISEEPNYLKTTSSLLNREDLIIPLSYAPKGGKFNPEKVSSQYINDALADGKTKEEIRFAVPDKLKQRLKEKEKKKEIVGGDEQKWLDGLVHKRMQQKLQYLENPRYGKSTRGNKRLLTVVPEGELSYFIPVPPEKHPEDPHFLIDPPQVIFGNYEIGKSYDLTFSVRNITAVKRKMSFLPPRSDVFCMKSVKYPTQESGDLAPGIAAKVTVRFMPKSLSNYDDFVVVLSESVDIKVPLLGYREPPNLTLPREIDAGPCLIGDVKITTYTVENKGGDGRFRLLTEEDYPVPRTAQKNLPFLNLKPFYVFPSEFELKKKESCTLQIMFSPFLIDKHETSFLVVCDNCTVSRYTIKSVSVPVNVCVSNINQATVDYNAIFDKHYNHLYFDPVPLGSTRYKRFDVYLDTLLNINFRWEITRSDLQEKFEISPAKGVFKPNESLEFCVSYTPSIRDIEGVEATLILENLPVSSVARPEQYVNLDTLKALGTLPYPRLTRLLETLNVCEDSENKGQITIGELQRIFGEMQLQKQQRNFRDTIEEEINRCPSGLILLHKFVESLTTEIKTEIEEWLEITYFTDLTLEDKRDIETCKFTLRGSGDYVRMKFNPAPQITFPGQIYAEKLYETEVELVNLSDSPAQFNWNDPIILDQFDTISNLPLYGKDSEKTCNVSFSPSEGLVEPYGKCKIKIDFIALATGNINIQSVCEVVGGYELGYPTLYISAEVVGASIQILDNELDFGLLSVGKNSQRELKFTNRSEIDASWSISLLGTRVGKLDPTSDNLDTGRSSHRDTDTASEASGCSIDSFHISSPFSKYSFSPSTGILEKGQSTTVKITCESGKLPQRLRGVFDLNVKNVAKSLDFCNELVSFRGEVQELKVYLDTTNFDLDVTYIDVPIKRYLTVKNLSNLETNFKFERPLGKATAFEALFTPESGPLGPKESVLVELTYTAKMPGIINEVFACKVFGMSSPLGFCLNTVQKGVVVAFELLKEGMPLPEPLGAATDVQYTGTEPIPTPGLPLKLNFEDPIDLYQRKTIRFCIRNLGAIPAKFRLRPKRYMAPPEYAKMPKKLKTKGRILDDKHEKTEKFYSSDGREYILQKIRKQEDAKILSVGLGAAFILDPPEGHLVPWGVTEVTLHSFNNMPGNYLDDIECDIVNAPISKLSTQMTVVGCPLAIRKDCVGLDCITNPDRPCVQFGDICTGDGGIVKKFVLQNKGPVDAIISWHVREADANSDKKKLVNVKINLDLEEKIKTDPKMDDAISDIDSRPPTALSGFTAEKESSRPNTAKNSTRPNTASSRPNTATNSTRPNTVESNKSAKSIRSTKSSAKSSVKSNNDENPQDISIEKDTSAPFEVKDWADQSDLPPAPVCKVGISFYEPPAQGPPFKVEPANMLVKAMSNQTYNVTLKETKQDGKIAALLVCDAEWIYSDAQNNAADDDTATTQSINSEKSRGKTKSIDSNMLLGAIKMTTECNAITPHLNIDKHKHKDKDMKQFLKFETWSNYITKKNIHESMKRSFVLVNPLPIAVTFKLDSEKPFRILGTKTKAQPHPLSITTLPKKNEFVPTMFNLGPGDNVHVELGFIPPRSYAESKVGEEIVLKKELRGDLTINFATGHVQNVILKGIVLKPVLVVAPATYHFGVINTEACHTVIIYLCNPSEVDARWSVKHIPKVPIKKVFGKEAFEDQIDDSDVFVFNETEGIQRGPTLPLPSAASCLPEDYNRLDNAVWSQPTTKLTWKDESRVLLSDELKNRNDQNFRQPRPILVTFKPKKNFKYRSRFRFEVENGIGFDVMLSGKGTYEENKVPNPMPKV